ncbi:MAG: tetraacyldisaccharide 4'-kinase [Sulfuricaulis sp.]
MYWLERHWYRKTPISLMLLPVSWLYCLLIELRRRLYQLGILPSVKLSVPVIVVGNITVGGTGKTPFIAWLASFLRQKGLRPGIILRGYGGSAVDWPHVVTAHHDPDVVGDEAVMLARQNVCPVAADPDRVRAAQCLLREHNCNVIVSDDGLQHLRLARDIEIAVIDAERRFGNGYCLPAGPLREPVSRLQSVSLCIANGLPGPDEFGMMLVETALCQVNAPDVCVPAVPVAGNTVHAVAGIGHPARFFSHLRRLGWKVIEHPFPDHYRYRPLDIRFSDNLPVIMTQKDAVKCERFAGDNVWYLAVVATPDPQAGDEVWRRLMERSRG